MATVTPNFDFPIPQSTDLVKDGATAIAALGTAIDTDFVDLKGGTTGQILAKASNTDLDYTWITNDVGDITAVTAGTGITGGGTSGAVTVSFDQANFGGGQYAAGKNKLINGDFGIWQRGTSFSGSSQYTADRWLIDADTSGFSQSRQSFTAGTAPVSGYEGTFFMRTVRGTGGSYCNSQQRIEDVRTFANQTVTLSFWAKASASCTIEPFYIQNFGSGGSGAVSGSFGTTTTLTTSWVRYSYTVAIPSVSGKTIGTSSYLNILVARITSATNVDVDTWGVQLESGSTATPFQTATGTIAGELAACQRYYQRPANTSTYALYGFGAARSTTQADIFVQLPVAMRIAPTAVDYSTIQITNPGVAGFALSALTIDSSSNLGVVLLGTTTGLTQYRSYALGNNGSTGYLGLSAEL